MIYHISTEKEWAALEGKKEYAPEAFKREGFIHTSELRQLEGVLQRYYSGRNDLLLLVIDETKLSARLLYEPSTNAELYPHIYGALNKNAIVEIIRPFNPDGLLMLKARYS